MQGDEGGQPGDDDWRAGRAERERRDFEELARTKSARLRDELIESHLGLVKHLVRRFTDRGEPYDDLVQVGSMALVKSVDRFDPDRGVTFATYATKMIVGELKRHFRDKGWSVRAPRRIQELYLEVGRLTESLGQDLGRFPTVEELAAATGETRGAVREAMDAGAAYRSVSLDASPPDGEGLAAAIGAEDEAFAYAEWRAALLPHLKRLSRRDRLILRLRFFNGMSQSEIANRVGLSQMHVSRRLSQNLDTLRSSFVGAR